MTTNFGCGERRTMESQPSVYKEDRNILRLRAWEQRNQGTSQATELNTESVPLFGQPYKTNKGDELSNRIQRMLGSYEDVNNPCPFAIEPLPIPAYVTSTQSDQSQTNIEKTTQPSFHNQVNNLSSQSQRAPSVSGYSSQPVRTSTAASSSSSSPPPNNYGHFTASPARQQKKSKTRSDHRVEEMSPLSPDVKLLVLSNDLDNTDMDTKDTFNRLQLQETTNPPSESSSAMDISPLHPKQSPKEVPLTHSNKGNTLPSQTFPSLLSSKQPSVVMTQKPTAYVRPMDGQDQVVSESPELKPSPEPYVPLPELVNKADKGKRKVLPPFLETKINEAQCVEDILKEMTHSWPPLLTAIHTPSTGEPSKSPFPSKETERVSSCPEQKNCVPSPRDPSKPIQLNSSCSSQAAHSRGVESGSSSDSESSSRSESDSESITEELPQLPTSTSIKPEPDTPAVSHGDWQLGNWIRSSQSSRTESQSGTQAPDSPTHKQPKPAQSAIHSGVEAVNPSKESKPQLSIHMKESIESLGKPQLHRESPQDNYDQQSSQKPPSTDWKSSSSSSKKLSCNTLKTAEPACSEGTQDVVATGDKDSCFTDRPKVKTKAGHGRKNKDSTDSKRDTKRTSKHTALDKRKARSEPGVTTNLHGRCLSCGVSYPNPCSCPTQSPAQPNQLSPASSVTISCSKPKSEMGTKTPHKTSNKQPEKTGHAAKGSLDKPPRSLLVRIDLSLLTRVPQNFGSHQETPSKSKRSVLVVEQVGGGGNTTKHKLAKTSKKSIPQNAEVETKTIPKKKQRLENKNTSSSQTPIKLESSSNPTDSSEQKTAKKKPLQQPAFPKDAEKDSNKSMSAEAQGTRKETTNNKNSRKHKRKQTERTHSGKKPSKKSIPSSSQSTREVLTKRPLLQLEDRQYSVKHYIKEAKKLKHKADAESDKVSKAFFYLEAAMFFVESGIAMEKDPQISMSSYTMFAETVELLKFVLKLKSSADPSTAPSEKDFLALCLKSQSLLQMAMFRHKHKTALKYSKTLTDHFHKNSGPTSKSSDTLSPMPSLPSPANTSSSSCPGSNHSSSSSSLGVDPLSSTMVVPQAINQVAFTYVNITMLFLSAHDIWEQAEELARKGSGLQAELDTVIGSLSLMSSLSSMVHYIRQGVHWLRLDSLKVK
ncbi:AF4/FMR2 family member 1 isoform X1 [Xyrichtys novacula]|uniref:AF4/FMR2 family member 1 isoform X1 n=1 Tax=Xyrichtys novacula TaxID=13765 RepID=A0AAV1GDK8_XYRNO|nr:AF4/FMR2 family member 1 isoform X1 [Xyrichtys novacula]